MDAFWANIYPYGHLLVAIFEFILFLFAYPFFRISRNWAMIVLPIVLVSTIYDNLILWSGRFLGEGNLLENLSQVRFFLHYLVVPLFIVVAIELAYRSQAKWANQFIRISSWLLAFGLAIFDIIKNFIGLELKPEIFGHLLRYVPLETQIPIITIFVNLFVLLVGIGIWVRTKDWRWLLIGSVVSLIGNALPSAQFGPLPGSASEAILALSLLLTQYNFEDDSEEEKTTEPDYAEGWQYAEYDNYQIYWQEKDNYRIYQTGSHRQGNFVRIYAPKTPSKNQGKIKVITYLHGFSLCLPKFYEKHLEQLVNQGFYVFFPDYQKSDYPDFYSEDITYLEESKKPRATLKYWLFGSAIFLIQLIFRRDVRKQEFKKLTEEGILKGLTLALGTIFFIVSVNVVYLFSRRFGKNLVSMITTVIESLRSTPKEWLAFSVQTTIIGWNTLCKYSQESGQELDLSKQEIEFYVFGHSLGGLLALSWPYYLQENKDQIPEKFHLQQIITGDPAPNTALGVPKLALWILGIFRFPFATQPLKIEETGKALNLPVGILHGNDDKIVKPTEWVKPPLSQEKGAFFSIASTEKNIYFSQSNRPEDLIANHNQSVTNTTYYSDGFMSNFGGVKKGPNAYNFEYIWPALDAVILNQVSVNKLSNGHGFELENFEVFNEPQ
ncbi:MAG: hypothetical protein QNJ64_03560 [Crocosphaera sp.]|nr:hypothetical protein [Crocosphaera sp.]